MNFIITKDIDGNEILLNLENVSAIEQYKKESGARRKGLHFPNSQTK